MGVSCFGLSRLSGRKRVNITLFSPGRKPTLAIQLVKISPGRARRRWAVLALQNTYANFFVTRLHMAGALSLPENSYGPRSDVRPAAVQEKKITKFFYACGLDNYKKICYNLKKTYFFARATTTDPRAEEIENFKKLCYNIKKMLAAGASTWHTSELISIYKNLKDMSSGKFYHRT